MKGYLKRFVRDESGLELVEYALMLALLIIGIALATAGLKGIIGNMWNGAADELEGAAN